MISFDEAVEVVRSAGKPLGTETVGIAEAGGRVLAEPVVAQLDSPRSNVSSMDGYAVRDEDLEVLPAKLEVRGKSFAGAPWGGPIEEGTCIRIFTGAAVPERADRIVIQEDVRCEGDRAIIDDPPPPSRFIRSQASDFAAGDELLAAGRLLDPRAIVACGAADLAQLKVYRRPRLAILSTGDELVEPGTARGQADTVPESISAGIAALSSQWGCEILGRRRLRDDLDLMREAAKAAASDADVIVVTGGASVGEKDFARAMFEPLGLELIFSRVSMKPGKPVWLGRSGDALVMGLPGNPTSALVTARLLLAPLVAAMTGQPVGRAAAWRRLALASPLSQCGPRETFHRARLVGEGAEILPFQDSGAQKALAQADLLVRQASGGPALEVGAEVQVLDF